MFYFYIILVSFFVLLSEWYTYVINSLPIDFKGVFDTEPGLVISYTLVMLLSCSYHAAFMLLWIRSHKEQYSSYFFFLQLLTQWNISWFSKTFYIPIWWNTFFIEVITRSRICKYLFNLSEVIDTRFVFQTELFEFVIDNTLKAPLIESTVFPSENAVLLIYLDKTSNLMIDWRFLTYTLVHMTPPTLRNPFTKKVLPIVDFQICFRFSFKPITCLKCFILFFDNNKIRYSN